MADKSIFVYLASYDDPSLARADFDAVRELMRKRDIGTYDAALVIKDQTGHLTIHQLEKPKQHGALAGLAVGALVSIFFPLPVLPVHLLWGAASGAGGALIGGLVGHFWKGISRQDLEEIGTLLNNGSATIVVIGKESLEEPLRNTITRQSRVVEKEMRTDIETFAEALEDATDELLRAA